MNAARARRGTSTAGVTPLEPRKKWQAITLATLGLVPGYWAILAGLVDAELGSVRGIVNPAAALAFGFAIIPFVFVVLAFMSGHPRAPGAVLRAMGLCLLIGIPVSALAGDAVTGIVAGVGAGGVVALRKDDPHNWKARSIGVAVGAVYAFILVRTIGPIALLPAPIFPFTSIGIADHISERRHGVPAAG